MPPIRVSETVETADGVDFVVTDISPDGVLARGHYALLRPAAGEAGAGEGTATSTADPAEGGLTLSIVSLSLSSMRCTPTPHKQGPTARSAALALPGV